MALTNETAIRADGDAIQIDASNNVGIGTSSPLTALHVNGTTQLGGASQVLATYQDGSGISIEAVDPSNTATKKNLWINAYGGNVGIGTNSPNVALQVAGVIRAEAYGGEGGQIELLNAANSTIAAMLDVDSSGNMRLVNFLNTDLLFLTNTTERMRIDTSGRLLVNRTSASNSGVIELDHAPLTAKDKGIVLNNSNGTTNGQACTFLFSGTSVGYIATTASSTAYVTSSDYRLKTAVNYDWDATTRLKQLRPARFKWIVDGDDAVPVDGFLAHEVQDIVPEAINGTKDAMKDEEYEVTPAVLDEDGNVVTPAVMGTRSVPDYQGIDQSKLVPLLVKAIQELEARITALEAN